MDTTEDFDKEGSSEVAYYSAPSTLSAEIRKYAKDITPLSKREDKFRRSHTPLQMLSNGKPLWDFMDVVTQNLTAEDMMEFHKELDRKGYSARSAYLEVMLNGLFKEVINEDLHQGHYNAIKDVYDNFNNPLEMFEDQVESVEKDKTLFAIIPYELYGDLLVQWLVTRKYIKQAINVPSDGSMEKITWSYLNALFDHRFNDTLSENDFLHCVKGLHGILEKDIQKKYDVANFGKEGINASIHTPAKEKIVKKIVEKIVYVEKESEQTNSSTSTPSLLQQRKMKNKAASKSLSYEKDEVKNILTMASQLSDKLDIPIMDAFDKAEEILSITQSTGELQYPPPSLESQIAREQVKNKNRSRPPPPGDSLAPYEEVLSAESWQKRSAPSMQTSPPTAELSSYAAAAKRFYEKLPMPEWVEVRRKKAQAAIRPATKPNQFFVRPQVQSLLNHFKPGLCSTGWKLLIELQDAIEHQENWDIVMDKTKLIYAEWTSSNALLLTMDIPLSQDQQGLYRMAVAHYLEQEVSEMRILNRPTTSSLKFCRVPTRNTWDGKVFTEDDLLRMIQADKLWKNAEIFGKPRFIKPKHVDSLPPVATVLIDIKDTKKGEDAKALIGSTVIFSGQHCRCLPWVNNDIIPQCQSCYRWGHTKFVCRMTFVTCARCGDNHPMDSHVLYCGDCLNGGNCERITCVNCRGNGKDNHSALDTNCPFRKAQNNREAMRVLMEDYRVHKAQRIEENTHTCEQQRKEAEKAAKKKGLTVKDLRAMLDNVEVVKGQELTKAKTGPLGKTTARKSAAQPPVARLIIKPGEPSRVAGITIKKPKFGKPRTPSPKGMDIDNPIQINSSPLEGSSVSKNLDPHV
ncbi:hypothetical protein AX15_005647 [Amanita polypyramis BW_CC]|nr:hypothetical protein AX15_005647 [Amanita polypyramis BW_CC]